jgi:4,5-dihydroxyphthalate decarboxylase
MSLRVPLTLACWDYDRTLPLAQGDVRPAGVDLTYLNLPVEETFFRMARFREFEAAELSLSSYVISLDQDAPFVAIPVFPSRAFRHNGIYVHAGRGITEPADLAGRLVGVPEYQLTAAVWILGILAQRHGLPVASVRYRTGGLHQPGRTGRRGVLRGHQDLPDHARGRAAPRCIPAPALAGPVAAGGVRGSQGAPISGPMG